MALLDILNQKKAAGFGQSFTQQASAMKGALTGKEVASPSVEKSTVAEDVATAQATDTQKALLQDAQATQQRANDQAAQTSQQIRLTALDYRQKESELVSQVQRQLNSVYSKLSESYKDMDTNTKVANMEQLEFLHNLADRKYVDKMQLEGDRRRLDNAAQLRDAITYATLDDQIDQLNSDNEFKSAFNANDRAWNEYLARINPAMAIQAALIKYSSEQSEKATVGMAQDVAKGAGDFAAEYFKPKEPKTEAQPVSAPTSTPTQPVGMSRGGPVG